MDKNKLQEQIKTLNNEQPWNHNIKLFQGIETAPGDQVSHGKNLVKWKRIEKIIDIIIQGDQYVLDIGCNEGYFTHKMAEKGAKVIGCDIDPLRIKKAKFVQSILKNNDVEFKTLDIYSDKFQQLQNFDFCLCMGFLHRIPDPYVAIQAISNKTNIILFEWKALKHGLHDDNYAYFSQKSINKLDYYGTEYWLLSYNALETILKRLNFKYFHRIDDPSQNRALLVAGKLYHEIFDQSDVRLHRGRFSALLSHTKRYLKTIKHIINGRLNS